MFFFDEAHLLFNGAPKALLEKIEQVVRLDPLKGVGVYFVTQNPLDVPTACSASSATACSMRCGAFTPRDQKAVKTAADMNVVERCSVIAPCSTSQPDGQPSAVAPSKGSLLYGHYEQVLDRRSA